MIMFIGNMSPRHISYVILWGVMYLFSMFFLGVIFNNVSKLGWITQTQQQTISQTATILDRFGQSTGCVVYTKLYMIYIVYWCNSI